MEAIDQAAFAFDPRVGVIVAVMVGFLVFAVALDLTWAGLQRVLRAPKAPVVGLVAQFGILPAVAFGVGLYLTDVPSVALGLLLVACCPGGALSNYLTGVARGDVGVSVEFHAVRFQGSTVTWTAPSTSLPAVALIALSTSSRPNSCEQTSSIGQRPDAT